MDYNSALEYLGFPPNRWRPQNGMLFRKEFGGGCEICGPGRLHVRLSQFSPLTDEQTATIKAMKSANKKIWMGLSREVLAVCVERLPQPIAEEITAVCPFAAHGCCKVTPRCIEIRYNRQTWYINETKWCAKGEWDMNPLASYWGNGLVKFHPAIDNIISVRFNGLTRYLDVYI